MTYNIETAQKKVSFLGKNLNRGTKMFRYVDTSVADPDPGSGTFLPPGSGIGFFRIPDPGSHHYF
jgi:hypothetical protein